MRETKEIKSVSFAAAQSGHIIEVTSQAKYIKNENADNGHFSAT
jgi:hypothetical protein